MLSQSEGLRFNRDAALNAAVETIHDGFYFVDMFANSKVQPHIYHYIITRRGSSEVLDWGQGFSLESMREQAEAWLEQRTLKLA
jgi:hypothetical protein